MGFKEQLVKLRKRKPLTQTDLANLMGVKQYIVSSWETGRSEPCIGQLVALSEIFEVPMDYLLDKSFVRATNEDEYQKLIENVHLDNQDDFLSSVSELCSDLPKEKKEKMLEIIKASIDFSK